MQRYAIWRMCSGPPRYYNPMNRQGGCPLKLPSKSSPAFLLPPPTVLAVWIGVMPFPRELSLLEVRAGLGVVALCL